jgi:hypothetical protein
VIGVGPCGGGQAYPIKPEPASLRLWIGPGSLPAPGKEKALREIGLVMEQF